MNRGGGSHGLGREGLLYFLLDRQDFSNSTELPSMLMGLRTSCFRFAYTFESGHRLVGVVEGDYFANTPQAVFNLRSLKAVCLDTKSRIVLSFDEVFGQFTTVCSEALFSGSKIGEGSFFSFNYRDGEACVYDASSNTWIATGWNPKNWQAEELTVHRGKPSAPRVVAPLWAAKAIA